MEEWEALDVDDSDLPSLLRPCKRRHENLNDISLTQSQSIHLTPSSSPHLTQTLDSPSHQQSRSTPLIPGPAGAVQSAMLRKTRDLQTLSSQDQVATQEYIRRAIENVDEDDDFKRNPWSSAIQFITADGVEDDVIPSSPLSSIKRCLNIGRADQVVAIIKSCTPNGLGDLMVTLKDPTGTVAGSIHRKVLSEGEFMKDISVGSVLVLQKVAIFSPSRSAHYLNITHGNIVKVFHKDSGPPLQQNDSPACSIKYAAPGTGHRAETSMLQKEFPLEHRRREDMMNEFRTSGNASGNLHDNNHQDGRNSFQENVGNCSHQSVINMGQNATVEKEVLLVRESNAKVICNEAVRMEMGEDECSASGNNEKLSNGGNLSGSLKHTSIAVSMEMGEDECSASGNNEKLSNGGNLSGSRKHTSIAVRMEMGEDECSASGNNEKLSNGANLSGSLKHTSIDPNMVGNCSEKEVSRVDAVEREKESLPQWTDEQLKELFALDGDFDV